MSGECMGTDALMERIADCAKTLREISNSKELGDGTQKTWACGVSSELLRDYAMLLTNMAIVKGIPMSRLEAICAAEREGRAVVLFGTTTQEVRNKLLAIDERNTLRVKQGKEPVPDIGWWLFRVLGDSFGVYDRAEAAEAEAQKGGAK
jgi:hypothetical protein